RDRGRREVVHALEGDVDHQVAIAGERVRDLQRHPRLHRLETLVEVVDVDVEELPVGNVGQRLRRIAGEIRHHAHDEGKLDLLIGAVELHVVLDLYAWRSVASDELLATGFGHQRTSWDFSTSPASFSIAERLSGIRSFTISRKFIWTSRCARRMSSGAGLLGSCCSMKRQTTSSICTASARVRRSPEPAARAPPSPAAWALSSSAVRVPSAVSHASSRHASGCSSGARSTPWAPPTRSFTSAWIAVVRSCASRSADGTERSLANAAPICACSCGMVRGG